MGTRCNTVLLYRKEKRQTIKETETVCKSNYIKKEKALLKTKILFVYSFFENIFSDKVFKKAIASQWNTRFQMDLTMDMTKLINSFATIIILITLNARFHRKLQKLFL